jgi:hypothetical protein
MVRLNFAHRASLGSLAAAIGKSLIALVGRVLADLSDIALQRFAQPRSLV